MTQYQIDMVRVAGSLIRWECFVNGAVAGQVVLTDGASPGAGPSGTPGFEATAPSGTLFATLATKAAAANLVIRNFILGLS